MDRSEREKIQKEIASLELETAEVFKRFSGGGLLSFTPQELGGAPRPEQREQQETPPAPAGEQGGPERPDLQQELEKLRELVGLDAVKREVEQLADLAKVRRMRRERGFDSPDMSLHMVFMGNPGTGKTTVARIISRIYCALGVLSRGQLVEVDRSGLVAGYVGQTAQKTKKVIESALGGVLFIDEAYTLARGQGENDFGQEAIDTLLKAMEDHREDLVVIVAGYSSLMPGFISSNPGLESRFNKYLHFEDYDGEQLFRILESFVRRGNYILSDGAARAARKLLEEMYQERGENFGNAREVRNLFERMVTAHAGRVAELDSPTDRELQLLTLSDLKDAAGE